MQGAAAASLRRLHEVSKALSTKELHKIIDEPLQGEAPRKLTPAVIADLEQQAHVQGLLPMDTETRPGSTYIPWEVYTSEEIEGRARRQGLGGRDLGFKVIPSDSGLRGVPLSEAYTSSVQRPTPSLALFPTMSTPLGDARLSKLCAAQRPKPCAHPH
eukprot:5892936-Amphidinium_carterae.1